MRGLTRSLLATVVGLQMATEGDAQTPFAELPDPSSIGPPIAADWRPAQRTGLDEAPSSFDFIFGLPTGFRLQLGFGEEARWQAEGFLGLELIYPTAGVGLRRRIPWFEGRRDGFVISP